jgi:hypothetical protein
MSAAKKHLEIFLVYLFFACLPKLSMTAQEKAKNSTKSTLLGSGHGIDHVASVLETSKLARKLIATFSVSHSLQAESTLTER